MSDLIGLLQTSDWSGVGSGIWALGFRIGPFGYHYFGYKSPSGNADRIGSDRMWGTHTVNQAARIGLWKLCNNLGQMYSLSRISKLMYLTSYSPSALYKQLAVTLFIIVYYVLFCIELYRWNPPRKKVAVQLFLTRPQVRLLLFIYLFIDSVRKGKKNFEVKFSHRPSHDALKWPRWIDRRTFLAC